MVTLWLAFSSCSLARQEPQQPNQPQDNQTPADEQPETQLGVIAKELRAIREQYAKSEQERTAREQSWWSDGGPPVWSNWALFIIAIIAGWYTRRAFLHQRDAARLTERADVLIHKAGMNSPRQPEDALIPLWMAEPHVIFKNFGLTRGVNFRTTEVRIELGSESRTAPGTASQVIGAKQTSEFRFPPLGNLFVKPLIATIGSGENVLRFYLRYEYTDVFGVTHHGTSVGRYMPEDGRFSIEHTETA
jgi:hypothetical protein